MNVKGKKKKCQQPNYNVEQDVGLRNRRHHCSLHLRKREYCSFHSPGDSKARIARGKLSLLTTLAAGRVLLTSFARIMLVALAEDITAHFVRERTARYTRGRERTARYARRKTIIFAPLKEHSLAALVASLADTHNYENNVPVFQALVEDEVWLPPPPLQSHLPSLSLDLLAFPYRDPRVPCLLAAWNEHENRRGCDLRRSLNSCG